MKPDFPTRSALVVSALRYRDESVLGYLLRLGELNGYSSLRIIKKLISDYTNTPLFIRPSIVSKSEVVAAIAKLANIDEGELMQSKWKTINSAAGRYFNVQGTSLPLDALMEERAQICPKCLEEHGYLREAWDLSGVTVCALHKIALIDICPDCKKPLSHARTPMTLCSHCKRDLRYIPTEQVSDQEVTLSEYFSALAPYRIKIADDGLSRSQWTQG
ncbi:TniQ family protein [Herminiimonas glaciei]|uniref:TniQ family protein n=1 Tax=Herminiimonas glaciei TaxID=523788 RepID=A0ABW2I633_9BURK